MLFLCRGLSCKLPTSSTRRKYRWNLPSSGGGQPVARDHVLQIAGVKRAGVGRNSNWPQEDGGEDRMAREGWGS